MKGWPETVVDFGVDLFDVVVRDWRLKSRGSGQPFSENEITLCTHVAL